MGNDAFSVDRPRRTTGRAVSPGRATIEARLALYTDYAAIMAEQETALEARDIERFTELNATRKSIEAAVEALPTEVGLHQDAETVRTVQQAVETLQSVATRQKRLEVRLKALRAELKEEVGTVEHRRGAARSYLEDEALGAVEQLRRIDVRS